jgi:spoIIIJ-associated protein
VLIDDRRASSRAGGNGGGDMEWVETTGRTIEEALDAALDQLGVHEEEVEYEVLAEPRGGLFGRFGGSEARIRARVKPISREKPNPQRRRRGGRADRGDRGDRGARSGTGRGSGGGRGKDSAGPARTGASGGAVGTKVTGEDDGGTSERTGGASRRRRRRQPTGVDATRNEGDTMEREAEVPIEEQAEAAEAFTRGVVDAFGAPARVEAKVAAEDSNVVVEITGDNLGLLVGPKGATLHALEELVRTVVQRQTGGHGVRINVDVAGYRAKRRAALEEFTREVAERVIESGREHALEPMSSLDRKVVHDVAAEIDGVETISEGEEPRRRVVLRPA